MDHLKAMDLPKVILRNIPSLYTNRVVMATRRRGALSITLSNNNSTPKEVVNKVGAVADA